MIHLNQAISAQLFFLCSILDNAVQHNLPLAMSFLDLQNAFGSIHNILYHVQLLYKFLSYITIGYTHLSGSENEKLVYSLI